MKRTTKVLILLSFICYRLTAISQGTWSQKTNFGGTARYGASSFVIGTKAYLIGGIDGTLRNDVWEYNAVTGQWTQKGDFPGVPRYQAVAFAIGNKGYLGTGAAGASFPFSPMYNDFWEYDPTNDKWTKKADFGGIIRFGAIAFSINGKGYIGTGFNENAPFFLKDFWEYDPSTNKWTQKKNFGGPQRMEAVGFAISNKGYVVTGGDYSSNITVYNDCWEYDPATDNWTKKADFGGTGRSLGVAFVAVGKGYVGIGGDFASQSYPDFWEYSPNSNKWNKMADFGASSRWLSTAFSINDKGYVATGGNFSPTYKDLWMYSPSSTATGEYSNEDKLIIYPACGNGIFQLSDAENGVKSIEIYSATGQKVYSAVNPTDEIIDLTACKDGIYFIHALTGEGYTSKKIIISK